MFTRTQTVVGTALALLLAFGAAGAAAAAQTATVTASPAEMAIGDISTITAADLGALTTVTFGLDSTPGGSLKVIGASGSSTSAEVDVVDGKAGVDFSSTQAGTFTIAVSDGETVLGTTTVTVDGGGGSTVAQVAASPASVTVGTASTITASGLGGLADVDFGLDGTPGGTLSAESARVSDGTATVEFTATEAGTFTVAVSDGETVLGTTTVTVTVAQPSPTPTPSPTPAQGSDSALLWIVVVLGLLAVAAIVTIIVLVRRRSTAA